MDSVHHGLLALVVLSCLLCAAGCMGSSPSSSAAPNTSTPHATGSAGPVSLMLTGVPDVRQAEYYSCGASSLQAVICYYGLNSFETDLRSKLSTNWTHGTYSWDIVRVAKELGFDADWKENLTFADLESALRQGVPPIVRAQHYSALNGTWENTWTVGHYMVVIGLDDRDVYLEDPYLLGSRLKMTRDDFNASWHSYVSEVPIPPGSQKHYHEGVFIRGTPAAHPEFIGIQEKPSIVPPVPMQQ